MPSVCIHAHFYQPSRENPWTGLWEDQPSAAPYANWNARICDECYAANGAARLLDETGRTRSVRNTYLDLNFDVGPTLMRWLECNRPAVYQTILRADQTVAQRLDGAGPAIAQGYHHAILPLCDAQDRRTELAWGLRDFEHRFGRPAHGLWLPETAVDLPTLCEVARQGIHFVILAPHQAEAVRPHNGEWTAPNTADWTQRPYTISLPNGDTIVAFFYDGALARGVAFDGWLHDGEQLAERLIQAGHGDGLVHFATDGESYGHHHPRGEMALARAAECLEATPGITLTTYEAYLRAHPPEWEARVHALLVELQPRCGPVACGLRM